MAATRSPDRESYNESSPLLSSTPATPEPLEQSKISQRWLLLIIYLFFLVVTIDVGEFLAVPPKTRVFEASLCFRYYQKYDPSKINDDGTVAEELCKINAVQEKLAAIMGWSDLFDAIPGILLAVPYGALADKYGRKWVFALSLAGLFLNSAWVLVICMRRTMSGD